MRWRQVGPFRGAADVGLTAHQDRLGPAPVAGHTQGLDDRGVGRPGHRDRDLRSARLAVQLLETR